VTDKPEKGMVEKEVPHAEQEESVGVQITGCVLPLVRSLPGEDSMALKRVESCRVK